MNRLKKIIENPNKGIVLSREQYAELIEIIKSYDLLESFMNNFSWYLNRYLNCKKECIDLWINDVKSKGITIKYESKGNKTVRICKL